MQIVIITNFVAVPSVDIMGGECICYTGSFFHNAFHCSGLQISILSLAHLQQKVTVSETNIILTIKNIY